MSMSATYRCCCGNENCGDCCLLYCECPDVITITTCQYVQGRELYSCGNQSATNPCYNIPAGTVLGSLVCAYKLTNVAFEKVVCTLPSGQPYGCHYRLITDFRQNGFLEYSIDANYRKCFDARGGFEGDPCLCDWSDRVCLGNVTVPLFGSNWVDSMTGFLSFGCCEGFTPGGTCGGCTCRAGLSFEIQGAKPAGLVKVDCCAGPGLIYEPLVFSSTFNASWECTHFSKMTGTCPQDLNGRNVECSLGGPTCDCIGFPGLGLGTFDDCPCPSGQSSSYPTCAINAECASAPLLYYCKYAFSNYGAGCQNCVTITA